MNPKGAVPQGTDRKMNAFYTRLKDFGTAPTKPSAPVTEVMRDPEMDTDLVEDPRDILAEVGAPGAPAGSVESTAPLNRDLFFRKLIRELTGALETVIGVKSTRGIIAHVGDRLGRFMDQGYREGLKVDRMSKAEIARVLVDLKSRIGGDFYVISQDEATIVLGNRRCPFGDMVEGRPSLCMMTSSVFGRIAAQNTGHARVSVDKSIADGHPRCRISVRFNPNGLPGRRERDFYDEDR